VTRPTCEDSFGMSPAAPTARSSTYLLWQNDVDDALFFSNTHSDGPPCSYPANPTFNRIGLTLRRYSSTPLCPPYYEVPWSPTSSMPPVPPTSDLLFLLPSYHIPSSHPSGYPTPLPSAIHASCMPHSTLAPMPGANSTLDRPRGRHNPCAPCSSMDVHYITSSTLRRLKLKLSTPGKQSVDESQWLRIDLPSESGVYSYDVWPLGE